MSTDREPTRVMRPGQHAEAAATMRSRGRYPRAERAWHPEDDQLSNLDRLDRGIANPRPRPARERGRTARWVRVGLLLVAAAILGVLIGWFGVPAVPR